MARSSKKNKTRDEETPVRTSGAGEEAEETNTRRILRESLAIVIFALSIYLLLSLAAGKDLCGPIGGSLQAFFRSAFGMPASYLLTILLFTLGVFNLLNMPLLLKPLSILGLVGSVGALATLVSIPEVQRGSNDISTAALHHGGYLGAHLAWFLVGNLYTFGATLVTLTLGIIALIFATDRWILKAAFHGAAILFRFLATPAPPAQDLDEEEPRGAGPGKSAARTLRSGSGGQAASPPTTRIRKVGVLKASDLPVRKTEPVTIPPRPLPASETPTRPRPIIRGTRHPQPGPIASDGLIKRAPVAKEKPEKAKPASWNTSPIQPPQFKQFAGLPADSTYVFPSPNLLDDPKQVNTSREEAAIRKRAAILVKALNNFRISCEVVEIERGPVITLYELALAPGTKVKQITNLSDDLAMALKATSVRIVAPIPGKSTMGVEVPNSIRDEVRIKDLVLAPSFNKTRAALPLLLGKDGNGNPLYEDLTQMPHLLVAGATGAGKSVCLNTIIMSFLLTRRPEELQLILIDPKMVELSQFRRIPHLMTPVVTDMRRAPGILEWAVQRMDERYSLLHAARVRHLIAYNKLKASDRSARLKEQGRDPDSAPPYLPYIVIIVDEMADLMMSNAKETENFITRLAQKSRAVGIHLVMATQRPSADVITGLIKANMPTRIAFKVSSKTDSRIVVDQNGAEKLLGMGDMLYLPPRSSNLMRCQGTFVSDDEVRKVVSHVIGVAKPKFDDELGGMSPKAGKKSFSDTLYDEAVRTVLETGRGSTSLLQRKFQIGYTRAARLVDMMAQDGIVGKYKGSQAREVVISLEEWESRRKRS